jgi:hypothetical protein
MTIIELYLLDNDQVMTHNTYIGDSVLTLRALLTLYITFISRI